MSDDVRECFAVERDGKIAEIQIGPVNITWSTFGDRRVVHIKADKNRVDVYSSKTGRSLRVFGSDGEMS